MSMYQPFQKNCPKCFGPGMREMFLWTSPASAETQGEEAEDGRCFVGISLVYIYTHVYIYTCKYINIYAYT